MIVNKIASGAVNAATSGVAPKNSPADITKSFSEFLSGAIEGQSQAQQQVSDLSKQFASGQLADTHQLLIAAEKASLGLQLTVQVRNKVVEAYQEIMRTQM